MRQATLSTLFVMVALVIVGCDRQPEISADELAQALGISAWTVRLPSEVPEDAIVGLVLKHADGTEIGRGSGFSGIEPGEIVRVFLWKDLHEDLVRYAIVHRNGNMRGSMRNPFEGHARTTRFRDRIARPGDLLMKGAEDNEIRCDNTLHEGEYGWAVHITKVPAEDE